MTALGWGLVGGGEGSQIGFAHRAGSALDGRFRFVAGAMDVDPERGRAYGSSLGLDPSRSYGDWREMLAGERDRADRPQLVTVATPNKTHFEIAAAFLEAGFHVMCEKPLTMTLDDAVELVAIAERSRRTLAVNYGYSGYPMVRHMRAMVARGDLGDLRVVVAEFAGGFMADDADADNPRVRWRFDPAQAGFSAVTMDCGIHAVHLACFVTGQRVTEVSSDFVSMVRGRQLEDDSLTAFRLGGGIAGRMWSSGLAIGRTHGLTLQVFGSRGGVRWSQEQPNQLHWTPLNEPTRILERGAAGLSPEADRASRITVGHPEGMVFAFANLYRDLAEVIAAELNGVEPDPLALGLPTGADGLHTLAVLAACAESARQRGVWVSL